jgi:plastocyanin
MRSVLLASIAIITAAAVLVVTLDGNGAEAQGTVGVDAGNNYFCDPSFDGDVCDTTVTAGDTVIWTGVAGFHTVTECDASFSECPPSGGFASEAITQGVTYSHVFTTPGTYPYRCDVHPGEMRGRIIVLEVTPSPSPTVAPTAGPTADPTQPSVATTAPANTAAVVPSGGGPGAQAANTPALAALISGGMLAALAAAAAVSVARRR